MLSDFMKKAYAAGRVKKYSECYDTDPALLENESINFKIGEPTVKYPKYDIGDIIFVKRFQYQNKQDGRKHLFVIIDDDNRGVPLTYFSMLISSKLDKLIYDKNIRLNKDELNNLDLDSIVKTDHMYEIDSNEISFSIGKVDIEYVKLYREMYLNNEDVIYE